MNPSVITAVGVALPGEPIDNTTLAEYVRVSPEWIEHFVGNRSRHFATDLSTGEARHDLGDLCTSAAGQALADAGMDAGDLEFVILGTATPDLLMPATVNVVADHLGINQVPTFQVQSGCAGAVQALEIGRMMLATGRYRTGLVLGGDVCGKHMALDRDIRLLNPSELVNYVLFGDGAGAAVLSADPAASGMEITHLLNRFTGLGRSPGQIIDWFGRGEDTSIRPAFSEDYKAIEESVPLMAIEILHELLDECGWGPGDVDFLLPPQLSGRMTAAIVDRLDLPRAKEITCVDTTGNNGNALPFLQLRLLGELMSSGERAVLVAVESSKWIKGGLALERR
jgi:3-oxoacyl-[acyl-carrier-protein] synthase-3